MGYYNYHGKIRQRIAQGELLAYEYVEEYKGISPCMLLHFETEPKIRPIRKHRFKEYESLLNYHFQSETYVRAMQEMSSQHDS